MKNRIVVAFLVAIALAVCGPPLVAAPNVPLQSPVKVYAAPSLPVPSIITGDLAITFPGLEEGIAATVTEAIEKVNGQYSSLRRSQAMLEILQFLCLAAVGLLYLWSALYSGRIRPADKGPAKSRRARSPTKASMAKKNSRKPRSSPKVAPAAPAPAAAGS
ncbi:MAG TPA: hypothetical protein PLB91_01200 [Spirochaetales bacterium]|nr:hypothetical protein [Spirochaetales bacterium]HRY54305.1 hypothetical protein [Spirochaetia bacterium]